MQRLTCGLLATIDGRSAAAGARGSRCLPVATFIALGGSRERNGWAALSAGMHVADEETGDWLVRTVDAVLIVSVLVVAFTVMLAAFPA